MPNLKSSAIFRLLFSFKKRVPSVLRSAFKKIFNYLKEQNELAIDHHQAVESSKDEFFRKNYYHIRGGF